MQTDVLVIGGGPAGLAAAIAARLRGMDVTVADHSRPPIDKACGEGLMPEGIVALAQLGVKLSARDCAPYRGIKFVGGGRVAEGRFPRMQAAGVRRTVLHQAMIAR